MKRILVVGAGLSGCCVARELAEAGYAVDVIDRRDHVAGNCFDEYHHASGVRLHRYGPHIFHTSNVRVFSWLSQFTEWVDYEHRVVAQLFDGEFVPFPPNVQTLQKVKEPDLIDTFYRPYTEKMWGKSLEEIAPDVVRRVPIRNDLESRYFPKDLFQKMPTKGYTKLVENVLDHSEIRLTLNQSFDRGLAGDYGHVFNSMPIDEFFGFDLGFLPYRSIKFHHEVLETDALSEFPVVNFTDRGPYTRRTEWKNFPNHSGSPARTLVTFEEPCDFRDNGFERYYPVPDAAGRNRLLYKKYAKRVPENMTFIGRCGLYVYINMDQAVSSALATAYRFVKNNGEAVI